ncbi:hypothetical protein [Mycobacteroides abscessus]|uniref:hypothetical protein n=1 Tax=Mycobacteroides abscessus TaxID=36809 RepID=UPI001F17C7BB|nr:hypothetical protein [Mycobacteroides abscessus]
MKAYIYASPAGVEAGILSQVFIDFAELYRLGFLNADSVVWANAESAHPRFWALTDRSHLIHVHRATVPGYARLTSGRIRWGRTNDETVKKVYVDLDSAEIPGGPDKRMTLIVKHRVPGKTVKILDDSKMTEGVDEHGIYVKGPLSVIDLAAFKPAYTRAAGEYEENHAKYHGVNHIMSDISPANADLIREHLRHYEFDITEDWIDTVNQHLGAIEEQAGNFADELVRRLAAATNRGVASPDSAVQTA